ncbi:magnesium and cobalt transporter CorA [Bartonella tamiae Th307]|uniref:Magnesium transport protein CorA n=1 Tax=Bartonella tamiae Th239 TaxID=1094558 RepID=J0R4H1_9HYPH|nr:magnesium transporter CorA family protein [Bartonella tamiae]EJF90554.1 magnesium and cobalt transporter CorA [Bartonella tamiae Th239]EJF94068.1 magnesium and cobalt transporter CorA [Bartonella tamiae Th307]
MKKKKIEHWLKIEIPTYDDMVDIAESNRFYMENNVQYLIAPLIYSLEDDTKDIAPITFILVRFRLITVRYSQPKAIDLFISRFTKAGNGFINSQSIGISILLGLIEAATDRLADFLARISRHIEKAARRIFHRDKSAPPMSTSYFRKMLTRIGRVGTFLSMVRESIAGISRLLVYADSYGKKLLPKKDVKAAIESLERDTQSLEHYTDFLSTKMTFLLDTVVDMISTEQNAIIKIFSVAAVGFMPPTLIASIYGMNFQFMPELDEKWGYPIALFIMIVSSILPLAYFRKKGWL